MDFPTKKLRNLILVVLLALFLRAWAVALLPEDFDEPIYVEAALDYADSLRDGDFSEVIDYIGVREHPPLVRMLYAGGILVLGKAATYTQIFYVSRAVSAAFGVLAVLFLGLFDPLAGGLLAIHTLAIKYTSQAYLEAVPHALTIACVLAFVRTGSAGRDKWFWFSSLALGAAAAGKFTYIPVILMVLLELAFFEKKIPLRWMLLYAAVALATFFFFDVTLWHDPVNRLAAALMYHVGYSHGADVAQVHYGWYQPLIWVFSSAPATWHPSVFFYGGFDGLVALFALAGVPRAWRERRWLAVWFAAGILFLLLWPTKWPQYALTITPAVCLMAAESGRRAFHWVREQDRYWNYLREMVPLPSRWFWGLVFLFAAAVALLYFTAAAQRAVGRIGWSHLTARSSFLPGNMINDLLPGPDGTMAIATADGAAIWTPPAGPDLPDQWEVFNTENSDLPDDHVRALARDSAGTLWFGTQRGIAHLDGDSWQAFSPAEIGLESGDVGALAADSNGRVFAGSTDGLAIWDGAEWLEAKELEGEPVFDLFVAGDDLWIATAEGVRRYDIASGEQEILPTTAAVHAVLVDSQGTLWAATSGGLARKTGSGWRYYTNSNSGLPLNLVMTIAEVSPGLLWIGTSRSAESGGLTASFDGTDWKVFGSDNSGSSGSEPLAIAGYGEQVWIGTRSAGIDRFRLSR